MEGIIDMAYLKFSVNHQIISRIDEFKPVSDSKNYLTAGFVFETDEWEGKIVTAIFRNDEQAFEVILDSNNECLVPWELIDDGQNEIFVSCFAGDLITVNKARVRIYESGYSDDLESETPPTPSVYDQIVTRLGRVENLDVLAKTLPAGSAATVEKKIQYMTGGYLFEFGIPDGMPGEDGEDGQDGQDGYSPTVSITDIPGGSNITITDKNGVHSCNVLNGTPGDDGFSPIISSGSISGGHRVIIQDKYTTQSFDVMDGEDYVLTEQDKQEIADMVEVPGTTFYICTSSEYDPVTRVPTVQNPSEDVFYLVPAESGTSTDMFVEWIYTNSHWEMFGSASIDLTNYVQKSDIDVGLSSTSENPVQNKVVKAAIDDKVDKETGKGLSTNDFTNTLKTKLDKTNITYGSCATSGSTQTKVVYIMDDANRSFNLERGSVIAVRFSLTNVATSPKLNVNNTGAISVRANGHVISSAADAKYAGYSGRTIIYMYDGTNWVFLGWDVDDNTTYSAATQSMSGLMSAADKTKLDGMEAEANKTVVDDALSNTSTNPVQNKVVEGAVKAKADLTDLAPEYDSEATYEVGDYVTYSGDIYRCTTAITTEEAWTAAHWTQVAIGAELTRYNDENKVIKEALDVATGNFAYPYSNEETYEEGWFCTVDGVLYKCVEAITTPEDFNIDHWSEADMSTSIGDLNDAVSLLSDDLNHKVSDVKINGTSIVDANNEADIPLASSNDLGVVGIDSGYGVMLAAASSGASHRLATNPATSAQIKSGSQSYRPVVPTIQHEATFYGLAKASGDTTQSASSNTVGNYTDSAKVAIQKMLGIYEAPWELIREDTFTNATSASHTISVDGDGQAFELTDAVVLFELPVQNNESKLAGYIQLYYGNTLKSQSAWFSATQAANANANGAYLLVQNEQGLVFCTSKPSSQDSNGASLAMVYRAGFTTGNAGVFFDADFKINKVIINGVLGTGHYRLYGKRKWQ